MKKVPITERALLQRINRALAPREEHVRKVRQSAPGHAELGDFYCVDLRRNAVESTNVDLEKLGRELKVLEPWESMA